MSQDDITTPLGGSKINGSKPRSIHDLFTFYLSARHIDGPRTVTVDSVVIVPVYDPKKNQHVDSLVVHFKDARRSLKANKTQAAALWEIAGSDDYTRWVGVRVVLSKEPTRGGKFTIKISKPESEATSGAPRSPEKILKELGFE